jgi:predicted aminopeptidase
MSVDRWLIQCSIVIWLVLPALTGCADTRYYAQSVVGQVQMMWAARSVDDWLIDAATPELLKQRLRLTKDIRQFAVTDLHLPDNASYHRYADLQRRYVVWNVVAAPEFSLTLKTWCVPVAGCVGYRGYFSEPQAQAEAAHLREQGLEASVYGVPAYSTLGWLNWLGGDPLLNTFIQYPQGEVARLVFHELSHQVLYVPDDTVFNESFATAVERLGGTLWLEKKATPEVRADYAAFDSRRAQFRELTRITREQLHQAYKTNEALALYNKRDAAIKNEVMNNFRKSYQTLKVRWAGFSGYDTWVAQANNAAFGAQAAYDELVPGFEALFVREGKDWPRFYDAVRQLAKRPKDERSMQLKQWTNSTQGG